MWTINDVNDPVISSDRIGTYFLSYIFILNMIAKNQNTHTPKHRSHSRRLETNLDFEAIDWNGGNF